MERKKKREKSGCSSVFLSLGTAGLAGGIKFTFALLEDRVFATSEFVVLPGFPWKFCLFFL
ncbi:MAG: hypothetical protein N838_13475 [Thiohalocapsa sp. PB-PSB1]|nr:MAG: hypothetical protein N838_34865 [Thiohalocapsa sp. PB-PSB1]QQO54204.1 MAG: hypothetical protein N838_13475 [Thiohalocapsa sp. PB-PSB1]HCS91626.1 hypothetical protein [Chromatiaceae bacterium]